jgi:formimidoylglutamate deiminase
VADCVAWSGQRPLAWLLDHANVDARWCLVHATHLSPQESEAATRSGAVAGLCPTTEANLGDGTFDASAWRAAGGRWAIGSDSHICVDAAEELMTLEYSQRLALRRRNILADARNASVATAMMQAAVSGGAQASGRDVAGLAVGRQADFVVLDARHPLLDGMSADAMLSAHVFASDRQNAIYDVYTAGVARVSEGRHRDQRAADARFVAVRRALVAGSGS